MNTLNITKTLTTILLIIVISLFIITGYGITNYRMVESLTLGILTKPVSFQLHTNLTAPLIVLVLLHITLALYKKLQKQNQS